ncbi:hypothetical protein WG947_16510 [Pontibacter sp. H259]|uniref:hypothetical protein n=1 Tax=Pontibacter sp. H259 TaxID=3133421 RepID=UPI0030BA7363
MENKQNNNPQSSSQSQSFTGQSSQSNQPSANQSRSQQPTGSSTGSSIGNQQSARYGSSSSSSSSSKIGGLDVNNITSKLQEFGTTAMNKVNGLSTTQKLVGGSLLALGAGWLAMNRNKTKTGRTNLNTTRTNKFGRSSS